MTNHYDDLGSLSVEVLNATNKPSFFLTYAFYQLDLKSLVFSSWKSIFQEKVLYFLSITVPCGTVFGLCFWLGIFKLLC